MKFLIAVAVLMCPMIAYAQISMHQLLQETSAFGIGLDFQEDSTVISGGLEYGIDSNMKGYFSGAISLADDDDITGEIPPSPAGGVGVVYISPLNNTGFDSYVLANGTAAFSRVVDEGQTITSARTLGLGGAVGLLKRLNTESSLKFTPFFGVQYRHIWANIDVRWVDESVTEGDGSISGLLGLGTYLSPSLLLSSIFSFSFETSDTNFNLTLTFY